MEVGAGPQNAHHYTMPVHACFHIHQDLNLSPYPPHHGFCKMAMVGHDRYHDLDLYRVRSFLPHCHLSMHVSHPSPSTMNCLTSYRPISAAWTIPTSAAAAGHCINTSVHLLASNTINTITDLIVVVLPIPTIRSLKLPRKQQATVIALFAAGFMACLAGIARTYYMYSVRNTADTTWAADPVWLTSSLELYIGIIAASFPATRPFFTTKLPVLLGLGSKKSKYATGSAVVTEKDQIPEGTLQHATGVDIPLNNLSQTRALDVPPLPPATEISLGEMSKVKIVQHVVRGSVHSSHSSRSSFELQGFEEPVGRATSQEYLVKDDSTNELEFHAK
jgi:hypothetical protein